MERLRERFDLFIFDERSISILFPLSPVMKWSGCVDLFFSLFFFAKKRRRKRKENRKRKQKEEEKMSDFYGRRCGSAKRKAMMWHALHRSRNK